MNDKLEQFLNRDDCYFIHYASNGFYNGSSPAPKISCIAVLNSKTNEGYRFCIADYLKGNSKEEAERLLLEKFKQLFTQNPNIAFIHWNMTANGFGFQAINARANELSIELPTISNENLFDLSSYVSYLSEKRLSIKQILWFNSLLYGGGEYLDGKTEAEYYNQGKYEEIYDSVALKVEGLSGVVKLIKENKLKTEPPYQSNFTKKEKREQLQKIEQTRNQILKDLKQQGKMIEAINKKVAEELKSPENEEDIDVVFFDTAHPILSMFCNWFANKK